MNAIRLHGRGRPEQLVYEDAPKPALSTGDALVLSSNPVDSSSAKLQSLIDSGVVRTVIAEAIPLAKARQAFERAAIGHVRGKLVLQVVT